MVPLRQSYNTACTGNFSKVEKEYTNFRSKEIPHDLTQPVQGAEDAGSCGGRTYLSCNFGFHHGVFSLWLQNSLNRYLVPGGDRNCVDAFR